MIRFGKQRVLILSRVHTYLHDALGRSSKALAPSVGVSTQLAKQGAELNLRTPAALKATKVEATPTAKGCGFTHHE